MINALLRFELKYHFRQPVFWVAAFLFTALGIIVTMGGSVGGPEVHKNAPYAISTGISLLSLFLIFVTTLFGANVVLRDGTYKMNEVIFTTSVKRWPYFIVRLSGLLIAVFLIICFATMGIFLGTFMANPEQFGAYRISYFLQPLFVFGLPNALFCSSVIFSTALLTSSMRAVYAAGVSLFILYLLGSILGNSPIMASSSFNPEASNVMPYLLDPFGVAVLFGKTRNWSLLQRNTEFFSVQGAFLANRLCWIITATLVLLTSFKYFKFRLVPTGKARNNKQPDSVFTSVHYRPAMTLTNGFSYASHAFLSQLKMEVTSVFKHIPFLVMMALWVFLNAVDLKEAMLSGPYGIRFYSASGIIAEQLVSVRPALLLLVFYAAELIHRERAANMQELVFSSPVFNTVLWGAKCATLAVLVMIIITANIGIGVGYQLFKGGPIELSPYLSLYYYSGVPLFLFAVLIVFVQTIVSNKYLGMLLSLLVIGIFLFGRRLGIEHYLLRYAILPELRYSQMNGFGHYTKAINWYLLYWTSVAAVLGLLAAGLWHGSSHTTLWQRVKLMGRQWGRTGKLLFAVSLLTWLIVGKYIYNNTPTVNAARNSKSYDWNIAYEKKYKRLDGLSQPVITSVKTNTDLHPESGRYTVKGSYHIKNNSGHAIDTLWIGMNPEVNQVNFSIPYAKPVNSDDACKQYSFVLAKPLQPGEEMELAFSTEVMRSGFGAFNSEHSVVSNGSYIELEKYLPFFGYDARYEVSDPQVRKKNGLPPVAGVKSVDSSYRLVNFETTISTAADQWVVTVGSLQKEWTEHDRHYFHYKTEQPVAFMLAMSSARYLVKKENYKGIAFNIYYQQGQAHNVSAMLQAMKDAMDYGNEHFSIYPLKQLTLAEIPQYPGSATAYPGVVFSSERFNFMTDYSDSSRFNSTYATTAHEVAHQWFANKVSPVPVPGAPFLTESLAKYTEAAVVEKRFGKMYLRKYMAFDNGMYLGGRNMTGEPEQTLNNATDQNGVFYQKGGIALFAIKEMLGEEKMSSALQRLIEKRSYPHNKATASDLLTELYQEATPEQVRFINEYIKEVIIYDAKLKLLACKPMTDGRFNVQLQVDVLKTDQSGAKPRPLNPADSITIAVFGETEDSWTSKTQPIYLQKHGFNQTATVINIITDRKPAVVAIDPFYYLLDENRDNNIVQIK